MSKPKGTRPVQPVYPGAMELLFFYRCPHCMQQVALLAPLQPAMARCDRCGEQFPIVPVDERSVNYIKIMLDNGRAAVDPDFA